MKTYNGYTTKMKLKAINVYLKTGSLVQAREAVNNIPHITTVFQWVRKATSDKEVKHHCSFKVRRKALKLYYKNNQNASATARAIGVCPKTISNWVKQSLP